MHGFVRHAVKGDASASLEDRCGALQTVLHSAYGSELSALAEGYFELVYGCDPYTFVAHASSYCDS